MTISPTELCPLCQSVALVRYTVSVEGETVAIAQERWTDQTPMSPVTLCLLFSCQFTNRLRFSILFWRFVFDCLLVIYSKLTSSSTRVLLFLLRLAGGEKSIFINTRMARLKQLAGFAAYQQISILAHAQLVLLHPRHHSRNPAPHYGNSFSKSIFRPGIKNLHLKISRHEAYDHH